MQPFRNLNFRHRFSSVEDGSCAWIRTLVVAAGAALASACTMTHRLEISPSLQSLPRIQPRPQVVGLYLPDEFVATTIRKGSASHVYVVPLGAASAEMLLAALPAAFARVERVADTRLAADIQGPRLDAIIEPRIEEVTFRGLLKAGDRYGVSYRLNVFSPAGVPVGSWLVSGRSGRELPPLTVVYRHLKDDIEEAGHNLLRSIEGGAFDPFLAPLAALRQRADAPATLAADDFALAIESIAPAELAPKLDLPLAEGGPLVFRVSITNRSSRPVLVRDNDMRLKLGRSGLLAAASAETVVDRQGRSGQAVDATAGMIAGSGGLGPGAALGALLIGAVTITAEEAAVAAGRQRLREAIRPKLFGERSIAPQETATGAVFFAVPENLRQLEAGTLSLWLLRPESGESLQMVRPVELPGLAGKPSEE